ncbi:MAG: PKD domain-containing protein [Thermoplasmata archaeon]|nr:PKD domain-containing protein [Thermoplasmata archaeon]
MGFRMRPSMSVILITSFILSSPVLAEPITDPPNHPPVANCSVREDDLWTNMTVHFSSSGSYDIDGEGRISFTWDFGDGSNMSTLANPTHEYTDPGSYNVTLTVIDQKHMVDEDHLDLTVHRDYGQTDVIIKAIGPKSRETFFDPEAGQIEQTAVKRDGWVAYRCDLEKGDAMRVTVYVIDDRPVDLYLFKHEDFVTYMDGPWNESMDPEVHKAGLTDELSFDFQARKEGRYYVVIDNRALPPTHMQGPVEYTIYIDPWLEGGEVDYEPWCVSGWLAIVMAPVPVAMVVVIVLLSRRERR